MNMLEIFKVIDPINHTLFLKEARKQKVQLFCEDNYWYSLYDLINEITWIKTSQGGDYWNVLAIKYEPITLDNYTQYLSKKSYYI